MADLAVAKAPSLTTDLGLLYQADCLDIFAHVPAESVDLVFADPPFNLGKQYGASVDDRRSDEQYLAWCNQWVDQLVRVLAPGGSLFIYNLPRWNTHIATRLDGVLTFRHWIAVDMKVSLPVQGRLYPSHYSLLYFVKGKRPRRFDPPRVPLATCRHCGGELRDYGGWKDRMNPKGVNLSDVWVDISPVRHGRYKTRLANELSLKLMDRVLDIASMPGDLVLDPFAGAGTTLVAAELKGRHWIGIEIEDVSPVVDRFAELDRDRATLRRVDALKNRLWTDEALRLRSANGHGLGRFRLLEGQALQLRLGGQT